MQLDQARARTVWETPAGNGAGGWKCLRLRSHLDPDTVDHKSCHHFTEFLTGTNAESL